MPKVETYGPRQQVQQVTRNPRLNQTRVANDTLNFDPLVQGLAERKRRADETAAEETLIQFEREKNKLFFDPENGYFNTQGRNAYEGAEATTQRLRELQTQYADQLQSPEARRAFNKAAGVHVNRGLVDIDRHSYKGLEAYEISTMETRVENATESAALYWNNEEEANIQRAVGRNTIIDMLRRQGAPEETINERLQSFESQFQKARIDTALQNDLTTANELFEKFGNRLEGPDLQKVQANLNKANYDADVAKETAKIMGAGPQTLNDVVSMVEQMPSETPEQMAMKSEVLRQAKTQFTLWKQLRDERLDELYQGLGKEVLNGAITTRDIPGEQWNMLTLSQQEKIRRIEEEVLKGVDYQTDYSYYTEVMTLPDKELLKVDPMEARRRLDDGDYEKFITRLDKAKNPSGSTAKTYVDDLMTDSQRLKDLGKALFGKDPNKLKNESLKKYNAVAQVIQIRMEQEAEAKGRKLSPSEKNSLIEEFKTEYVVENGSFFGMADKTYELDDFSADAIRYGTEVLRSQGLAVNSVNLLRFLSNDDNRKKLAEDYGLDYDEL